MEDQAEKLSEERRKRDHEEEKEKEEQQQQQAREEKEEQEEKEQPKEKDGKEKIALEKEKREEETEKDNQNGKREEDDNEDELVTKCKEDSVQKKDDDEEDKKGGNHNDTRKTHNDEGLCKTEEDKTTDNECPGGGGEGKGGVEASDSDDNDSDGISATLGPLRSPRPYSYGGVESYAMSGSECNFTVPERSQTVDGEASEVTTDQVISLCESPERQSRVRRAPIHFTPTVEPKIYSKFTRGRPKPLKHPLADPFAPPNDGDVPVMQDWVLKGLKKLVPFF